ncbi:collagen-like protein [Ancylomarina sp. DW003]|nr:hypothetical protein [Ancylomarina sp. DW003]MDE5421332.1 collagen-like protein [Ancylomarina sp. DW003]
MKTRKFYYFLVAILALNIGMVACSGDDGEIGPDGLKGEQGVQGEVGPAGADGSIIYSGEGEPAADTGIKGDYYCDSSTGMLYGPKKENASWEGSDSFSLKGQNGTNGTNGTNGQDGTNGTNGQDGADGTDGINGQDGTNGSKIFSGEGIPSNNFGNTGDYYLDKGTYTFYGPAVTDEEGDTTWGLGLMLKGADGNANVRTFIATVASSNWVSWGSNITGNFSKTLTRDINFSALDEDMYDNGVILVYWQSSNSRRLLPETKLTPQKNFLTHEAYTFKNSGDGAYHLRINKNLKGIENLTELLTPSDSEYRIKLITGQPATELSAVKDNQIEFDRLVNKLVK